MPMTIRLLVVAFTLVISGCAQVSYYTQAAQGQLRLSNIAKPVDTWLAGMPFRQKVTYQPEWHEQADLH